MTTPNTIEKHITHVAVLLTQVLEVHVDEAGVHVNNVQPKVLASGHTTFIGGNSPNEDDVEAIRGAAYAHLIKMEYERLFRNAEVPFATQLGGNA